MLLSYDTQYAPNLILQYGYDYDFLGQLISADYSNAEITDESYTYDSNGNRLTANGDEYTTGTNNELTSDGNYTYTYDDEGNRISKQNSTNRELYTWDYRNRLTSVTQQEFNIETGAWTTTQTIEYAYDYNNVWIRKITGNNKTIFIPENYQTVAQIDNGAITHHYLWTPNAQDKLLADVTANNVLWSLTDHLGSIRDVVQQTSTGLVVPAHIIYNAYGNVISCTDSTGQPIENPILFGYTGKAFDIDTALQNNINRWYAPTVGRWLSTDPIGFEGNDTNLYRYVGNSTLNYFDLYGLESLIINKKNKIFTSSPIELEFGTLCIQAYLPSFSKNFLNIKILYKSNTESVSCDNIKFIQIVKNNMDKTSKWELDGAGRRNNTVDVRNPYWKNNGFPVNWQDSLNNPPFASSNVESHMFDEPGRTTLTLFNAEFYTLVVLENFKTEKIEILGYVHWKLVENNATFSSMFGFSYDKFELTIIDSGKAMPDMVNKIITEEIQKYQDEDSWEWELSL